MSRDEVYLRHILEALERISAYTRDGRDKFMTDRMIQDATVRNLEIVGEATKRLSPEFRALYPEVPWASMSGMRDVLIHDYMGVDLEVVWEVVENRLVPLRTPISGLLDTDTPEGWLDSGFAERAVILAVVGSVSLVAYLGVAFLLGAEEPKWVIALLRSIVAPRFSPLKSRSASQPVGHYRARRVRAAQALRLIRFR